MRKVKIHKKRAEYHFLKQLADYIEELSDYEFDTEGQRLINKLNQHINHYMFNKTERRRKDDGLPNHH